MHMQEVWFDSQQPFVVRSIDNDTKNGCVVDYLGALLGIIVGGVLSSSPNPDPISEQQESFSIPIFRPGL